VPQTLSESSAFHLVPSHRKKKTVSPGLTCAAAHSVPLTVAQSNFCMAAPLGRAFRIASEEQSALVAEPVELEVGVLLDVLGLGLDDADGDGDPQAERASTPTTGTTISLRTTRRLTARWMRRDRAVADDKAFSVGARDARVWVGHSLFHAHS
jgi:hypothetical protein